MKRVYELFFKPGEVVEIRAIGRLGGKNKVWSGFCRSGVVAGYFNDAEGFARAAASLNTISSDPPHGIYYTANPVRPDLLARAAGRLVASPKQSTQDSDIVCLRWLLVDMDPKRPAGISSSDEEKDAAKACGSELTKWLEESLGFGRGVRANSGNGYHVLYRLDDLPNTDENKALLQKCLAAIGARFNSDQIEIDQTVFNPARIWKLYGTHARKGDHITDRPWRQSMIMDSGALNSLDDIEITPIEKLEALAKMLPPEAAKKLPTSTAVAKPKPKARAKKSDALGELEVGRYLDHFGRRHFVKTEGSTKLFCLDECVFNPDHRGNEASVCQSPNPPYLTYQCFHNSCKGKTWAEAREIISGRESLAQFCAGFDPDYKARHTAANEMLKDIVVTPGDMSVFASAPVPPPHEMDPGAFFDMAGKRPKFVARWLANYMYALLGPIINYHSSFWRYQNGTWSEYSEDNLLRVGVLVLGDMVQPEYIEKSIKTLKGLV